MTILAGIMRNAGRHSNLVEIVHLYLFSRSVAGSDDVSFLSLPYECSWPLAALYLCHQMRLSLLLHSECVSVNFAEFSRNSMSWRMAHVNCLVNGSLPKGSGSVCKRSGGHPNQNAAQIRQPRRVNITRELSYIFTAVSPPPQPVFSILSDSRFIFNILGAYYFFIPATHRPITISLSNFPNAPIFLQPH